MRIHLHLAIGQERHDPHRQAKNNSICDPSRGLIDRMVQATSLAVKLQCSLVSYIKVLYVLSLLLHVSGSFDTIWIVRHARHCQGLAAHPPPRLFSLCSWALMGFCATSVVRPGRR